MGIRTTPHSLGTHLIHLEATLSLLVPYITVFARMSPQQKGFVIRETKAQGVHCLMCGDGTNDVAALKQAHVGVSIMSNTALEEKIANAEELYTKQADNEESDLVSKSPALQVATAREDEA